jgi:hypothetical protein
MAFRFTLGADQNMESPAINMPTNHNRQNPRTHHTMIVSTVNIGLPSDVGSVRLGSDPYKANKMKPAAPFRLTAERLGLPLCGPRPHPDQRADPSIPQRDHG